MADTPDEDTDRTTTRTPRKRTSAPRTSARGRGPAKTSTKKASAQEQGSTEADSEETSQHRNDDRPPRGTSAATLALEAAQELVALTGKPFEGIVGVSRNDHAWDVEVEVLEMSRIPSTTDVIAVYRVTVDQHGELVSYRRVHRYLRGQAGDER
jgi:hypothetical protein